MATNATNIPNPSSTNKKPIAVNSIIRPVPDDVLAQQPPLKRNQQQGCQTLSGLQIDARVLINRFLSLVPLVGTGVLGDKIGPVTCKDLMQRHDYYSIIQERIVCLYGRMAVIRVIMPYTTPDRNFLTIFDAETYVLLDCVEIVCNNKYCVLNKISNCKFSSDGYVAFKICAHIDMDAMSADPEYSLWFKEHGFPLDDDSGLYKFHFRRNRGKDCSTPPPPPERTINTRWDLQVFYINPDFKFRQAGLPRPALPYQVLDHGIVNIKVMQPTPGTNKLLVEIIGQECGNLIIYDHMPRGEIPYPFVNTVIDVSIEGSLYKNNDRYFTTFYKEWNSNDDDLGRDVYKVCIKSYDIFEPTKVVYEFRFDEERGTDSSEKYILLQDGRIEIPTKKLSDRKTLGLMEYSKFYYPDSQGLETVIYNSFTHEYANKKSEDNDGEVGYQLEVTNDMGSYTVQSDNIYKLAQLKSLLGNNGIFSTHKGHFCLDAPSPKNIIYSPDGRFIAMVFNSEESNYSNSNMQGVLVFEKTQKTKKWRAIGYVNFPDHDRFFGVKFLKSKDELGYALIVSNGSKSGKDIVYLPDELAEKYYSRLHQANCVLGLNNMILRQISKFLAYKRFAYQDLGFGIAKNNVKPKAIKNERGFQKPFINSYDPVIYVDTRKPIITEEMNVEPEIEESAWGKPNSAWDNFW